MKMTSKVMGDPLRVQKSSQTLQKPFAVSRVIVYRSLEYISDQKCKSCCYDQTCNLFSAQDNCLREKLHREL